MLSAFRNVNGSDVDYRASNSLCRQDDNIVVFGHLEVVQGLARGRFVQDTVVDCLGHRVIDELGEDEAVPALIKKLHGICGNRQTMGNVGIAFKDLYVPQ